MPCYEERIVGIELNLNDTKLLKEILDELGLSYKEINGTIKLLTDNQEEVQKIKKKYAEKLIRRQAQAKGWQINKTGNKLQLKR
jgi:hypothetical protein